MIKTVRCIRFGDILLDENRRPFLLCTNCHTDYGKIYDFRKHLENCSGLERFFDDKCSLLFDERKGSNIVGKSLQGDYKNYLVYELHEVNKLSAKIKTTTAAGQVDLNIIEKEMLDPRWYSDRGVTTKNVLRHQNLEKDATALDSLRENVQTRLGPVKTTTLEIKKRAAPVIINTNANKRLKLDQSDSTSGTKRPQVLNKCISTAGTRANQKKQAAENKKSTTFPISDTKNSTNSCSKISKSCIDKVKLGEDLKSAIVSNLSGKEKKVIQESKTILNAGICVKNQKSTAQESPVKAIVRKTNLSKPITPSKDSPRTSTAVTRTQMNRNGVILKNTTSLNTQKTKTTPTATDVSQQLMAANTILLTGCQNSVQGNSNNVKKKLFSAAVKNAGSLKSDNSKEKLKVSSVTPMVTIVAGNTNKDLNLVPIKSTATVDKANITKVTNLESIQNIVQKKLVDKNLKGNVQQTQSTGSPHGFNNSAVLCASTPKNAKENEMLRKLNHLGLKIKSTKNPAEQRAMVPSVKTNKTLELLKKLESKGMKVQMVKVSVPSPAIKRQTEEDTKLNVIKNLNLNEATIAAMKKNLTIKKVK